MTWFTEGHVTVTIAVVGVVATVVGVALGLVEQGRKQAAARQQELQAKYDEGLADGIARVTPERQHELQDKYNQGVIDGKALIAPDVNLMRSERDAALRDLADVKETIIVREKRITDLEDRIDELRRGGG